MKFIIIPICRCRLHGFLGEAVGKCDNAKDNLCAKYGAWCEEDEVPQDTRNGSLDIFGPAQPFLTEETLEKRAQVADSKPLTGARQ